MKKEQLEKVQAEVSVWTYLQSLPPEKNNFKLKILMQEVADTFQIYSYENDDLKRKTTIYYHEETKEYKLLVTIGLTEFCAIEYISESLDKLEVILKERFDNLLGDISHFNREHISSIIEDKAIMDWEYIDNLPKEIDGFKLFINPKEPVKIIMVHILSLIIVTLVKKVILLFITMFLEMNFLVKHVCIVYQR